MKNEDGYLTTPFPGKKDQLVQVIDFIKAQKMLPDDIITHEVDWFYKYSLLLEYICTLLL